MVKSELLKVVSEHADISHEVAELGVNIIFDSMAESLAEQKGIEIRGFGSFEVRQYDGRKGRNSKTGNIITVGPKKRPFFKVGKQLRQRVNGELSKVPQS
jgi:integration host factor subunit beta